MQTLTMVFFQDKIEDIYIQGLYDTIRRIEWTKITLFCQHLMGTRQYDDPITDQFTIHYNISYNGNQGQRQQ